MINIPYTINQSKEFINVALKYFGIKDPVRITISRSKCPKCNVDMELKGRFRMWRCPSCKKSTARIYPDIWCEPHSTPKTITVTGEWARQSKRNREVRLTHEILHFCGMEHNNAIGYITYPDKDRYSRKVYNKLIKNLEAAKRGKVSFKRNEVTTTKQLRMVNPYPKAKVWSGLVDLRDGVVEQTFTYEQAKNVNFHHSRLVGIENVDAIDSEDKAYFWIDRAGYIRTWGSYGGTSLTNDIEDKIRKQLKLKHRRTLVSIESKSESELDRYPLWGNPFPKTKVWSGVVDLRDGVVEETFTYKRAKDEGFHHSHLVSRETNEQIEHGEKAYFWVDQHGDICSWIGQNRIPSDMKDKIKKQLGIYPKEGTLYRHSKLPMDSSHWAIPNPRRNPCPDVSFTLDPRPSVKDYMLVSVDIDKFDKSWSTDSCYIDRSGKGKTGDRLNMFKEFLATGKTIEAPIVELSEYRNGISFTNGRHRFCTFRDMGCKRTVVSIAKKDYNKFRALVDAVPFNDFAILKGGK